MCEQFICQVSSRSAYTPGLQLAINPVVTIQIELYRIQAGEGRGMNRNAQQWTGMDSNEQEWSRNEQE